MARKKMLIFPLYEDVRRITAILTDDQMGKTIRQALACYYDGERNENGEDLVKLATAVLLEQAGRYDQYREQMRKNALSGGKNAKQSAAKCSKITQSDPPNPIPNPNPSNNIVCQEAISLLNSLSGSSFRENTKSTQQLILAREKDGYSADDIKAVIRHQCKLWKNDSKMSRYLRPATLFGNKFESYLSDAMRCDPQQSAGYVLAPAEDPWDVAMRGNADG